MHELGAAQGGHSVLGCWDPSEEGLCEPEGLFHDMVGMNGAGYPMVSST